MRKLASVTVKLYLFAFFDDFILIYPLYTLLFADKGVSPLSISSLLIVWSAVSFLLEIPTGILADRYSRKKVLVAGILLRLLGYLFWLLMQNYVGFLIGFILWGIKSAITSGALEALVYDELQKVGRKTAYAKLTGRMTAAGTLGVIAASLGASLLAKHGYDIILLLSLVSIAISALAIATLPKSAKAELINSRSNWEIAKQGVSLVLAKPKIVFLVLFMGIVAGLGAVDEYYDLFLREKGYSNSAVAFWTAVIFILGAVGSLFAHRLEGKKLPVKSALFGWAILLYCASIAPKLLAPFLLGVYVMFFFGVGVLFNSYLQNEIGDDARATVTSVGGFVAEAFAIVSFLIVSVGASHLDYKFGFQLIAITIAIVGSLLAIYAYKKGVSA